MLYLQIGFLISFLYISWAIIHQLYNVYNYLKWYISGVDNPYESCDYDDSVIKIIFFLTNKSLQSIAVTSIVHLFVAIALVLVWPLFILISVPTIIANYLRNKNIQRAKLIKALTK